MFVNIDADDFREELLFEWNKLFVVFILIFTLALIHFAYVMFQKRWSSSVVLALSTMTVLFITFIVLWIAVVYITDAYADSIFYEQTRWLDNFNTIAFIVLGILCIISTAKTIFLYKQRYKQHQGSI
ncbi:MAG TPA: hypothetical protein IAB13_04975 [Candidatus Avanaerovorax faecigallinarum]|nr:hypothetical protein [Candidatus Avanaerovorax faecigallinarum]